MQCLFCADTRIVRNSDALAVPCPQCEHLTPPAPEPLPVEEAVVYSYTCTECGHHDCWYVSTGSYDEYRNVNPDEDGETVLWISDDSSETVHEDSHDSRLECKNCHHTDGGFGGLNTGGGWEVTWM